MDMVERGLCAASRIVQRRLSAALALVLIAGPAAAQTGPDTWGTLASTPTGVHQAGTPTLVWPGSGDHLYGLRGFFTKDFWRYSIDGNTWETLTGPGANIDSGGCAVYPGSGTLIYALRGYSTGFMAYDFVADSWAGKAAAPKWVDGASMAVASDPNILYALIYTTGGTPETTFQRYSISGNSWAAPGAAATPPANGNSTLALVSPAGGDILYALVSGNPGKFWRYSISGNSWAAPGAAATPPAGNLVYPALGYPGSGDFIYASGNSNNFWRYSISGNSWTVLTAAPANWGLTASIAYPGGGDYLYAWRGGNTQAFWRYQFRSTPAQDVSVQINGGTTVQLKNGALDSLVTGGMGITVKGASATSLATLDAEEFDILNLASGGLEIQSNARILKMRNCVLGSASDVTGNVLLDFAPKGPGDSVEGPVRANVPASMHGMTFNGANVKSVRASPHTPPVRFTGYNSGADTREVDPYDRLEWLPVASGASGGVAGVDPDGGGPLGTTAYDSLQQAVDAMTSAGMIVPTKRMPLDEDVVVNKAFDVTISGFFLAPSRGLGGGVYAVRDTGGAGTVTIVNCVVAAGGLDGVTIRHCTVFPWSAAVAAQTLTAVTQFDSITMGGSTTAKDASENIAVAWADRAVYFQNVEGWDHHLRETAANAINQASSAVATDLDGASRDADPLKDIGAFELGSAGPAPDSVVGASGSYNNLGNVSWVFPYSNAGGTDGAILFVATRGGADTSIAGGENTLFVVRQSDGAIVRTLTNFYPVIFGTAHLKTTGGAVDTTVVQLWLVVDTDLDGRGDSVAGVNYDRMAATPTLSMNAAWANAAANGSLDAGALRGPGIRWYGPGPIHFVTSFDKDGPAGGQSRHVYVVSGQAYVDGVGAGRDIVSTPNVLLRAMQAPASPTANLDPPTSFAYPYEPKAFPVPVDANDAIYLAVSGDAGGTDFVRLNAPDDGVAGLTVTQAISLGAAGETVTSVPRSMRFTFNSTTTPIYVSPAYPRAFKVLASTLSTALADTGWAGDAGTGDDGYGWSWNLTSNCDTVPLFGGTGGRFYVGVGNALRSIRFADGQKDATWAGGSGEVTFGAAGESIATHTAFTNPAQAFFASSENKLYSIDLTTGTLRWGGRPYAFAARGKVNHFDVSGTTLWVGLDTGYVYTFDTSE